MTCISNSSLQELSRHIRQTTGNCACTAHNTMQALNVYKVPETKSTSNNLTAQSESCAATAAKAKQQRVAADTRKSAIHMTSLQIYADATCKACISKLKRSGRCSKHALFGGKDPPWKYPAGAGEHSSCYSYSSTLLNEHPFCRPVDDWLAASTTCRFGNQA